MALVQIPQLLTDLTCLFIPPALSPFHFPLLPLSLLPFLPPCLSLLEVIPGAVYPLGKHSAAKEMFGLCLHDHYQCLEMLFFSLEVIFIISPSKADSYTAGRV